MVLNAYTPTSKQVPLPYILKRKTYGYFENKFVFLDYWRNG